MLSANVIRLRALLADAARATESIGSDPKQDLEGIGYFADATVSGVASAIEQIAAHDGEITLFVGAGVSMESEMPSWNELVRRLLVGARDRDDPQQVLDAWAGKVLEEGPLAAAAVAESLYEDHNAFERALREALYAKGASSYAPGALAGQIAWLKHRFGGRLAILTVNYDRLLEDALAERGLETASYVRSRREPAGKAAVWHLHGRVMRTQSGKAWTPSGNLVLSEGSYVRSTTSVFPQDFVADRLQRSLCVFVGLSMTDPNFIRWLYGSADKQGGPRFVIFVRQASPIADRRVREILEDSAAARWARYNVTPVWANYYGEVAQIVHEIGLRCDGGRPSDFADRARLRMERAAALLCPADVGRFAAAQAEAAEWLRSLLDGVREICANEDPPIDLAPHGVGLGLWAVDHEKGRIFNWVSSDRAYQHPGAIVGSPLHVDSPWVAAAAIANGVSVEEDPMVYASRWRFVRAIPVTVQPEGERSIVGAVTLTSTTPLAGFPLSTQTAPRGLLSVIDAFLCGQASKHFLDQ